MLRFLVRRLVRTVLTLCFVGTVGFALAWNMPTIGGTIGQARAALVRTEGPILDGYVNYVSAVATGDLGYSVVVREPVASVVAHALPWTILLVTTGTILTYGVGIAVGSVQAYLEGSPLDLGVTAVSTLLLSIPFWVLGILFVYWFSYQHTLFPPFGMSTVPPEEGFSVAFFASVARHLVLPLAAYASTAWAQEALIMRGNSIRVLGSEHVRSARIRGLGTGRIAYRYVARNALLPMYTNTVVSLSYRFGFVVILEDIFRYEGIGWFLLQAFSGRDVPLMMATFLTFGALIVLGITVLDVTYRFLDPRTRSNAL